MGIITPKGLAEALGVSRTYVYQRIKRGLLPIGLVVQNDEKCSYTIFPEKVREIFGDDVYLRAIKYSVF